MIKSVRIQSFEAHDDTTIEFGEGMNSIVGLSNSGKSAIIRALMVVVDNEWSKDMVRTGSEFCRVRVETERGWVEAERGEKVNRWRCQENGGEIQCYQKVGTSVPELATKILGMGRRERGGGVAELPNFQTQLEKHYMLSEIGDKKATSNMIAVMMDNAIGLGGMEDLIKDFSSDLVKDKKWLTEKQSEIVDLKSEIEDELIFSAYEKKIMRIGDLKDSIEKMDEGIDEADKHMQKYNDADARHSRLAAKLSSIPDSGEMESLADGITKIDGAIKLMESAQSKKQWLDSKQDALTVDVPAMETLVERHKTLNETIAKCQKVVQCQEKLDASEQVMSIDHGSMETLVAEIDKMGKDIKEAEKMLSNAREVWKSHSNAVKNEKSLSADLARAEVDFEKLKDELGVCPLCGNKL